MKIKTNDLLSALELLVEVVPLNKLKPITEFVEIECKEGIAYFSMTNNYHRIRVKREAEGELSVCLNVTSLLKLAKLFNKEYTTITEKDDYVEVKADGKYKFSIGTDDIGNRLCLNLTFDESDGYKDINLKEYANYYKKLAVCLPASGTKAIDRIYSAKGISISTNAWTMCILNGGLFDDEFMPDSFRVLSLFDGGIEYKQDNKGYNIRTSCVDLYIPLAEKGSFPVESVMPIIDNANNMKFSGIPILKSDLKSAIKKLEAMNSLGIMVLEIADNKLLIKNERETVEESISDTKLPNFKIKVSSSNVIKIIGAMEEDINICLGNSDFIVLKDSNSTYIISKTV